MRSSWTAQESKELELAYNSRSLKQTKREFIRGWRKSHPGRTENAIDSHILREQGNGRFLGGAVEESRFTVYDTPLEMVGDALILNDLHCPFHHAEFINQCLMIAKAWGIKKCIIGGDLMDMKAVSNWGDDYKDGQSGRLAEAEAQRLHDFAMELKGAKRDEFIEILEGMGAYSKTDSTFDEELVTTGRVFNQIAVQFEKVDVFMGNHDNWMLRALGQAVEPDTYRRMMGIGDNPAWRFSSYYYSVLISGGEKWQIEHPNLSGKYASWQLAANELCNIIMAHNHHVNMSFDRSGTFWAIESGCCADPSRIEYASKRHRGGHKSTLGAVIVRNGYPYMLTQKTDWEFIK